MIAFSHDEALLFRVLTGFFGKDRVVPNMSVAAVCGGTIPEWISSDTKLKEWAKKNKCLFTIIDGSDVPKLVIEFFSGFDQAVDAVEEEHQRYLPGLLKAADVTYISMTKEEFSEIVSPSGSFDLFAYLEAKVASVNLPE